MKKATILTAILSACFVALALTTRNEQDSAPTYATVAYSSAAKFVYVYYGKDQKEEIEVKRNDNPNQKILDVLNNLSSKGFELVSSSSHSFNLNLNKPQAVIMSEGNYTELYYTLRKK